MQEDNKDIIKGWVGKSDEALSETDCSFRENLLATAQNRLYYAIFYIIKALAVKEKFNTSKHTELLGWFNKNYVRTKIIESDLAGVYKDTYEDRHKSDYTLFFSPSKEDLLKDIERAKELIGQIKDLI